jgi:hypothetical protein
VFHGPTESWVQCFSEAWSPVEGISLGFRYALWPSCGLLSVSGSLMAGMEPWSSHEARVIPGGTTGQGRTLVCQCRGHLPASAPPPQPWYCYSSSGDSWKAPSAVQALGGTTTEKHWLFPSACWALHEAWSERWGRLSVPGWLEDCLSLRLPFVPGAAPLWIS